MNNQAFHSLIDRYLTGDLSGEEKVQFSSLLEDEHYRRLLEAYMEKTFMDDTFEVIETAERRTRLNTLILGNIRRVSGVRRLWAYAAAVMLFVGIGAYYLYVTQRRPVYQQMAKNEVAPGRNGAVLTLADGSTIQLDSLGNGVIARQTGAQILLKKGQLIYDPAGGTKDEVAYNLMSTPNGRQFQLKLPDGTNVWLNAASTIKYPTIFNGRERVVEVTGEAYFEVAPRANMPFIVKLDEANKIEVLGTHFNINAYKDETKIATTLLEGAVKVRNADGTVMLKPGQQALMEQHHRINVTNNADMDKVMAWKNGFFNFEGLSLKEAMRQLSKWYDIEIIYQGEVPDIPLFGEIRRNVTLNELVKIFTGTGLSFHIEDQKLIISK